VRNKIEEEWNTSVARESDEKKTRGKKRKRSDENARIS
jgi:hypothetical protein